MRKYSLAILSALVAALAFSASANAAPFVFTSGTTISVPDHATKDPQSYLEVTHPGVITRVEVRLKSVTHTRPADLDVIVETPSGAFIYSMSDVCGSDDITDRTWNFADDFPSVMSANSTNCADGDFKPSENPADTDAWTTAVDATPVASFAGLNGTNQTGEWQLHVADDTSGDTGAINSGWEIRLDTTAADSPKIQDEATLGPLTKTITGLPRTITDVNVVLNDLTHTHADDLDIGLQSPAGTKVLFASDGCGGDDRALVDWTFDDESPLPYPDNNVDACDPNPRSFAPANYGEAETALGALFTGGPFPTALSAFDGQLPNGDWKLFIQDDDDQDFGYIAGYDLAITIRGAKLETPSDPTLKSKKSGKKNIKTTGRVSLDGEALTASECAGTVKSSFQAKVVKKKGKKKVTSYKQVVSTKSALTFVAGKCGFDISAKLAKKYSGKKLRLVTSYLGGEFIAPFTRTTNEKISKIKFK